MKITKQIDRGIYVETWRRSESAEDIRAVFDGITESFNLTAELAKIEAAAMTVLRGVPRGPVVAVPPGTPEAMAAGLREGVRLAQEAEARGERPATFDLAKANPQQRDAAEVIWEAWHLRQAVASGNAAGAALRGYRLGRFFERMMVRPAESKAMTGRRVVGGGRKGAELAHGTPDKLAVRNERIIAAWESLRAVHLKESRSRIDRAVGKQFGLSERQVRAVRLNHRKES